MKTAKHILCMFLSLCLLAGIIPTTVITAKAEGSGTNGELIWDGSVADSYARGSGTSADPFIIETAEQLAKVAYQTSNGEAASSVYYKLADNIYLNDTTDWQSWETAAPQNTWMPIGSSTTAFSGYFDGAGYSIYGVYISTDENYQGLFGSVAGSRSITNLGVEESYIKGGDYVGGICGNSVSDITACHNCSTVIGGTYVGGIAGNIANPGGLFGGSSVNINNCYNTGGVNGTSYVGGVIGNADTGCLSGCYNIGTISGSSYVGGIAGRSLTCSGSWNAGNVTGTTYVGGVLGEATYFGASSSNVTSSFNAGQISGQSYVGGVVGRVRVYSGFYESYLNNCYNIGSIYADGEYAAGIVGGPNCTIVTNCYNVGSCFFSSSSNTSPVFNTGARTGTGNLYFLAGCCGEDYTNIWSNYVTEKSSDEMQASDFVTALGSSWKEDTGGYNHGYPILRAIDYDAYAYYTQSSYDGDSYIIDRVRSYTSDEIYAQYHDIMNSEESDDTKALRLYDLFYNNGLINVREGVLYLSYVPTDRLHYIQLTDNSIYTAYGYYNWLYNTPRGTIERGLLFVDGLIFNNEISTWLNPLTYVGETDLPGVKKYKDMLYNFMDYSSTEIENMQYVSTVMDIAENCTDIGKTYANNLISQINNCSSREERQRLMRSADAIGVYQDVKNEGTDLAS